MDLVPPSCRITVVPPRASVVIAAMHLYTAVHGTPGMAHGEGHAGRGQYIHTRKDGKSSRLVYSTARSINGTNTVAMMRPMPALEALGEPCCSGATGVPKGLNTCMYDFYSVALASTELGVTYPYRLGAFS